MNNLKQYLDGTRVAANSAHLVEDLKEVLVGQVARHDDVFVVFVVAAVVVVDDVPTLAYFRN